MRIHWTKLLAGPVLALLVFNLIPLPHAGKATAAVGVCMALWWMTEAIPIYATALLPLLLFPLTGAASAKAAAAPYGHHLIYLFLGGFIIAQALERWNLHRRIALRALQWVGTAPASIVGGFMAITAFMSMWVSNTATAMMMLPIAFSIIAWVEQHRPGEVQSFTPALLLGVAYAASIGGMGTLIGTPPNLFLASFLREHAQLEIGFSRWMGVGLPLVAVLLPLCWLLLTRTLFKCSLRPIEKGNQICKQAYADLGPMSRGEWNTLAIFILTALLWVFSPLLKAIHIGTHAPLAGLNDTSIAILGALLLFIIPVDGKQGVFTMNWDSAKKLPWGVLLLFGGGLSLAAALEANGVSAYLGAQVGGLSGISSLVLILLVTALMIFLTELTSNTASTVTFVPILYATAQGLGLHPLALTVPAALAASCAFMLPVATPPNAIVFGSGRIKIAQMVRAGLWLNILGIVLITVLAVTVVIPVLSR